MQLAMYDVVSLKSDITITLILPGDWLEVGEVGKVGVVVGEVCEVGKLRWARWAWWVR